MALFIHSAKFERVGFGWLTIKRVTLADAIVLEILAQNPQAIVAFSWQNLLRLQAPFGLRWLTKLFYGRRIFSLLQIQIFECCGQPQKGGGEIDLSMVRGQEALVPYLAYYGNMTADDVLAHTPAEIGNLVDWLGFYVESDAVARNTLAGAKNQKRPVMPSIKRNPIKKSDFEAEPPFPFGEVVGSDEVH